MSSSVRAPSSEDHRPVGTRDDVLEARDSPPLPPHVPVVLEPGTRDPARAPSRASSVTRVRARRLQVWAAFAAITITSMMSSLDGVVLSTALPSITARLQLGPDYVWAVNVYSLASAVVQPLLAQVCDLWGRRWVTMMTIAVFMLGSGLCGAARTGALFIGGRAVQGLGNGGINMMNGLLISDLVPLRDRSQYFGFYYLMITAVAAVGPLIGGALARGGRWRWIFYANLPIGGLSLGLVFVFLRVTRPASPGVTWRGKLARIDWGGMSLLALATTTITYAVTYGGVTRPWSDASITTPLVAGCLTMGMFTLYEGTPFPRAPVVPYRIFAHRTTAVVMLVAFLHSILALWGVYMLPIYFQAVLEATPFRSGIYMIPMGLSYTLGVWGGGLLVSRLGRYKYFHLAGLGLAAVAAGLFSILDADSSPAAWVMLQLLLGLGLGAPQSSLLPAAQASLDESDAALSTGAFTFLRCFGMIWSTTIPQSIFNNRFDQLLPRLADAPARQMLSGGQAYGRASRDFVHSFAGEVRADIIDLYASSLRRSWQIFLAFCLAAFVVALLEQEIVMRKELTTEYGLAEKNPPGEESKTGSG